MKERTVLFVDDDSIVLRSIARGLMDEPYNVCLAKSGKEALEILCQQEVHVLVTDIECPIHMNPYQEAYFKFMTQSREHVFYVSEHIAEADKWNTRVNMLMAIAGSSSIGAWIIWQQLSWMWAGITRCLICTTSMRQDETEAPV